MTASSTRSGHTCDADMILMGGSVTTVDGAFKVAEAVAVKDGRIVAVGTSNYVMRLRGSRTLIVNLRGRTVIPGLQDSHLHFLGLGNDISGQVDLSDAKDAADILQAIAAVKRRLKPSVGQWIVGSRWDQYKYPEMLTRWQLDDLAPNNPIRLNRTFRGIVVNSAVLRGMGIDDDDPSTWPAWWLEDPQDFTAEDRISRSRRTLRIGGHDKEFVVPTGVFVGARAVELVTVQPPPCTFEEDVRSVRMGAGEMLRLGVTSVIDPSSAGLFRRPHMSYHMSVYQEAYNRGWLTVRVPAVYEGTFRTQAPEDISRRLDDLGINNLGNSFLRWRGAKFYSDGGVGTLSAWMSEPFIVEPTSASLLNVGNPVVADDGKREAQYRAALEHGWDLHTHSCGDQAMRQTVKLYLKLLKETAGPHSKRERRWSVIHAFMPIERKTMVLPEMSRYGIIAVANPVFNWQQGLAFANALGEERMERCQPFRSYVRGGVILVSGSDYPVASHNPWIGIYAMLTRRDQTSGQVFGADETVDIRQALRSYTINSAYLTYEDELKGSLEVGKFADLVVLDIPSVEELGHHPELCFEMDRRVLLTMVDGVVRYRRADFDA